MSDRYDVIIGTGVGRWTLLNKLATSGKRMLVLGRGPFLLHGSEAIMACDRVTFTTDGPPTLPI